MLTRWLYKRFYTSWKSNFAFELKKRRVQCIGQLLGAKLDDAAWLANKRILEIGCGNGKDFVQFFRDFPEMQIYGIDLHDHKIKQDNFKFVQSDASKTGFPDNYFDICVSIGVLEHIEPIEKLSMVISEINRISKSFAVIIPSINTLLEPHTAEFLWQLRDPNRKAKYSSLNYFSDEAWLQFAGFSNAASARFRYFPLLITNTIIYSKENQISSEAAASN